MTTNNIQAKPNQSIIKSKNPYKQQAQIDRIRAKIEKAESSGFTSDGKEQILSQSKTLLNG
jgi:hypothetical protein